MKKKKYISPEINIVKIRMTAILSGSEKMNMYSDDEHVVNSSDDVF